MLNILPNSMAMVLTGTDRLSSRSDGMETLLLIVGLAFAGVLVWAIQRSGRTTA